MKILFGDMCVSLHTYRQIQYFGYINYALILLWFYDIFLSVKQWSIVHIGGIYIIITHTATSKGGKR